MRKTTCIYKKVVIRLKACSKKKRCMLFWISVANTKKKTKTKSKWTQKNPKQSINSSMQTEYNVWNWFEIWRNENEEGKNMKNHVQHCWNFLRIRHFNAFLISKITRRLSRQIYFELLSYWSRALRSHFKYDGNGRIANSAHTKAYTTHTHTAVERRPIGNRLLRIGQVSRHM